MNNVTAISIVKQTLKSYLIDPLILAGGNRNGIDYIFSDEPSFAYKYPKIDITKSKQPKPIILDIGSSYTTRNYLILDVNFYTKNGFKISVDGLDYVNAQLVEYYLDSQIEPTLKAQFTTMFDQGVKDYKSLGTSTVGYNSDTQVYFGTLTIMVEFFRR